MFKIIFLLGIVLIPFFLQAYQSESLSKQQLLDLAEKNISENIIISLINKNCIDFAIGPSDVIELSASLSEKVIEVAINCNQMDPKEKQIVKNDSDPNIVLEEFSKMRSRSRRSNAGTIMGEVEKNLGLPTNTPIPTLLEIPSGSFNKGKKGDTLVDIESFWMSKTEITIAQYSAFLILSKGERGFVANPNHPVTNVTWFDAKEYCEWLSKQTGLKIDLPTSLEWEYACRAGMSGPFSGNIDEYAWHRRNSGKNIHPVAQKKPNKWGLFDMHGNAQEWCADRKNSVSNRTAGCDGATVPKYCQPFKISFFGTDLTTKWHGFRVVSRPER